MKTIVLCLLLPFLVNAQALNELYSQSEKAFESKNYKLFLQLTQKMDSMRPMHPAISYGLATAYAVNGDMRNTFEVLKRISRMNNTVDIIAKGDFAITDKNFEAFTETSYYSEWQKFRKEMGKPVSRSEKVVTLDEKDLHPEGLCYAEGEGWLAGSIHKRKITTFDSSTGKCSDWLVGNNMLAVFAVKPDKNSKYLWAATAAVPEMQGYDRAMEGRGEVLKIDIATRKVIKRFRLDGGHLFGDLVVTDSGTIFVSDSASPVIYVIENDTMTEWLNLSAQAFSLQGITMDEKNQTLYIADYLKGILAVSLKDKSHQWLDITFTKGIDGLAYHNNSLYSMHNGTIPIRIVRYDLAGAKVIEYEVLDNNRPEFNEPVLGTFYNGKFYFFANAPWKAYDGNGNLNEEAYGNPVLYSLNPDK